MNWGAIKGLILRHLYMTRHHLDRLFEIIYWPIVALLLWGFLTDYLRQTGTGLPFLASALLGAIILWTIFESINRDISVSMLFDIWERNLINVFSAPVSIFDYIFSLVLLGVIRTTITFLLMAVTAFFLYQYNFFELGLPAALFGTSLIIAGWSLGLLVTGVIMLFGSRIGPLAWSSAFILQVLSAVFYPVDILPPALQSVSWSLPMTYVFAGMREIVLTRQFNAELIFSAFTLNGLYFAISVIFLTWVFARVKKNGALARLE